MGHSTYLPTEGLSELFFYVNLMSVSHACKKLSIFSKFTYFCFFPLLMKKQHTKQTEGTVLEESLVNLKESSFCLE